MAKVKTTKWNLEDYLKTDKDILSFISTAIEEGDPSSVSAGIGLLAKKKGMTRIANMTKLGRESLYKSLSPNGNPELATIMKVIDAVGYRLKIVPAAVK
jgi:probable addiction module antidote protein